MKTVFVVTRYKLHEDMVIYEIFGNWISAVEYCKLCQSEDTDGYVYDWNEWEVK